MSGFNFVPIRSDPMLIFLSGNCPSDQFIIRVRSMALLLASIFEWQDREYSTQNSNTQTQLCGVAVPEKEYYQPRVLDSYGLNTSVGFVRLVETSQNADYSTITQWVDFVFVCDRSSLVVSAGMPYLLRKAFHATRRLVFAECCSEQH